MNFSAIGDLPVNSGNLCNDVPVVHAIQAPVLGRAGRKAVGKAALETVIRRAPEDNGVHIKTVTIC